MKYRIVCGAGQRKKTYFFLQNFRGDGRTAGGDYYDRGLSVGEICTGAGVMKLIEMVLVFTTIFVHRYGDKGRYVFFGTANQQLQSVSTRNLKYDVVYVVNALLK